MATFRKKPSTIEAVKVVLAMQGMVHFGETTNWLKQAMETGERRHGLHAPGDIYFRDGYLIVQSPSGPLHVEDGDWIAFLNPADIHVIRADQFAQLYEPAI